MTSTEDRRVRKTKKAIAAALAELLKEKPLNRISVREISEIADINRGTFYLHYRDVADMAEKLHNEVLEEFKSIVKNHEPNGKDAELFPMLVDFFNLLSEHAELAKVLIGKNGDAAFVDKFKQIVREKCFADMKNTFNIKNDNVFEYFYHYIVSGCIGIFGKWLNSGMCESAEEMANLTEKLILTGISAIS